MSDETIKAEQIQTKMMEKRKLTWEEIERVTSKYGFEKSKSGNHMVRSWEHGLAFACDYGFRKMDNVIWFEDDYFRVSRPGMWYGSRTRIDYSDDLLKSTISALMELKNLE